MSDKLDALVIGINKALGWLQITTHGCKYTCPTKEIDGKLLFKFKGAWHNVDDHVNEFTTLYIPKVVKLVARKYKP